MHILISLYTINNDVLVGDIKTQISVNEIT